jgi:hypothetical protein
MSLVHQGTRVDSVVFWPFKLSGLPSSKAAKPPKAGDSALTPAPLGALPSTTPRDGEQSRTVEVEFH